MYFDCFLFFIQLKGVPKYTFCRHGNMGLFKENGICPGTASLGVYDLSTNIVGAEVT